MRDPENILSLAEVRPDFIGFIFYPGSKRFVDKPDPVIIQKIPLEVQKVGVFVNEPGDHIIDRYENLGLDLVQFHGDESPEKCTSLNEKKIPIIKAISVDHTTDFSYLFDYENHVDYFLFDTKTENYGGSGKKFNWDKLNEYRLDIPFFLGGGIGYEDLDAILALSHPMLYSIDINSKFETEPGIKNIELVKSFINKIRRQNEI